ERDRRVAVGSRRRLGRRSLPAWRLLRPAAGDLLPRSRHRCRDPAGAHAAARRWQQSGGGPPPPPPAPDRPRHRPLADPRGRPPGGGFARSRELAAPGAAGPAARPPERTPGLAALGALDLGDRRRLLVGGAARHLVDPGPERRGEPPPPFRLSPQ